MPLDLPRRAVLVDMAYEIGGQGLAGFAKFLAAIRAAEWDVAGAELIHSELFSQVRRREEENLGIILSGEFPSGIGDAQALIRHHEGCIYTAAPDAKGKWSIGWGHDIQPVAYGHIFTCSSLQADAWFQEDFQLAETRARADLGEEYW